jgi:chorismate-pyruvate lyase
VNNADLSSPDLLSLVSLFYPTIDAVGQFAAAERDRLPLPYRQLLAHDHHMTVTLEAFYNTAVAVRVLSVDRQGSVYSRSSLLTRRTDEGPVQFGIVRLHLHLLEPHIRGRIEEGQIPLGRVLIEHETLREVELGQLYHVRCGPALSQHLGAELGQTTYGRTALIHYHAEPAVELLEIVAPAANT